MRATFPEKRGRLMQVPLEVSFENCPPSEALSAEIARHAARLEKFSDRITSCRVVVHAPETRHRHGDQQRLRHLSGRPLP